MSEWKYWTPEHDGHAPEDWAEGMETNVFDEEWRNVTWRLNWSSGDDYRYRTKRPLQDAKYEPDLLAQCLALPQDQREALIEAMQKPQRDWADDVAQAIWQKYIDCDFGLEETAAVIRSMCRPKEDDSLVEALENIVEYWNRDQNETAMADALWHIIATAEAALTSIERRS